MATRNDRLNVLFRNTVHGNREIRSLNDGKLFLQAVCAQNDRTACVATLLSKEAALPALRKSLCTDLSDRSLNEGIAECVLYLVHEDIQQLHAGQLLTDLLGAILTPPILWNAYKNAAAQRNLSHQGLYTWARLVLALLLLLAPSSKLQETLGVHAAARSLLDDGYLLDSPNADLRLLGYKLRDVLHSSAIPNHQSAHLDFKAGGRHDNDFEDFREIAIFPTTDELQSDEPPFVLPADIVLDTDVGNRVTAYLDNQFRMLREDWLAELRENLTRATSRKQSKKRTSILSGLDLCRIEAGATSWIRPPAIAVRCWDPVFKSLPEEKDQRRKFLKDDKNIVRHGAFGCIMAGKDTVVAFATIDRIEELLAETPPVVTLRIASASALRNALLTMWMRAPDDLRFVSIDSPFFAYEPVLTRLQNVSTLPLASIILDLGQEDGGNSSSLKLDALSAQIQAREDMDLRSVLDLDREIRLDHSQTSSLTAGLDQKVSLIQGPPGTSLLLHPFCPITNQCAMLMQSGLGTGKSFIGALLAKAFMDNTSETILVLCYTNHALDQFLEDIMDRGVPGDRMLRLGSKSTRRTLPLTLREQPFEKTRLPPAEWKLGQSYKDAAEDGARELQKQGTTFSQWRLSDQELLETLEFAEGDIDFFHALSVPFTPDGMTVVGARGQSVKNIYLLERWRSGYDAGVFQNTIGQQYQDVWSMPHGTRMELYNGWIRSALSEQVDSLCAAVTTYEHSYERWTDVDSERTAQKIRGKRLVGCTTTAAAKYAKQIEKLAPGIVLVEEAGEVLESHVLTAMSRETKQLVLIGDHLQLRPKVNNYKLTVEAGQGYDLNRSLFERLVLRGHPHTVLSKQHRMRPEISALVRRLMYPDLLDDAKTLGRPDVRGLQSNVVFINHDHAEVPDERVKDRQDSSAGASRQNVHEVEMVLKIVRYLAQQGYGTEHQVVLTPYLGQLRLLVDHLKTDHDPVLSDLDSADLVKAGLLTSAGAKQRQRQLRVSTIDNFQGEESQLVIVSLTRSNAKGDIGFLKEPQRLNVLLSRARDGLIIVGNANTFRNSKSGSTVWTPFFDQLISAGQFFDGLPVACQQHPDRQMLLKSPADFDLYCPSGGCELPCGTKLSCNKHLCPEKCHQLVDHSKMKCLHVEESQCAQGHRIMWECWQKSKPCRICEKLAQERYARQKRDLQLAERRAQKEAAYQAEIQALEDEIFAQRRVVQDRRDKGARASALKQKRKDLDQARKLAEGGQQQSNTPTAPIPPAQGSAKKVQMAETDAEKSQAKPTVSSNAADAWEYQKTYEGASNEHLDALMGMIGLESVKQQVLDIKDKIDLTLRQGSSLEKERFGVVLLGNPGTGKTTVARLYAKCLAYMGAVPGTMVEETTASKLSTGGVPAFQKLVEKVLDGGGGAIFIDEAYQLATGGAGPAILDALLDEAENLVGKVVFLLAGYKREMEAFYAHNPGLPSRFPNELLFEDYSDEELLRILQKQIDSRYLGKMKVEEGEDGLYCRIVTRRVGRGRGRPGFGNARVVENAFAKVRTRQAARLSRAKRSGQPQDDLLLTREDLIGPAPAGALQDSKAWKKLQALIGLSAVKESVRALLQSVTFNYERELREEALLDFNLNRVFLGSPGTGKTTVAKLYGEILADLGLLSNGQVVVKNPSDFVGEHLGASEKNTRGILASSVGKVLVIDEAYGLYSGSSAGAGDIYKTSVVDTLVAEVQSVPGEDRCVLLLGYRPQMEAMMQNVNPGLSRRFPLSEAFQFDDFSDDELQKVAELKLKQQEYAITEQGMEILMSVLKRARNKPNFGNGGEVDILLNAAKERHQKRQVSTGSAHNNVLEAIDFDPNFDRVGKSGASVRALFAGTVGNEDLITRLEEIQKTALSLSNRGLDARDQVPFNFLFTGPPGTGKTTTARKMGKLYYDMGILGTEEVLDVSATELIGQYVGQTAPKTQQLLEKGLGKILFIDEAYRLADGLFAKEAIDELVDCLTKPQFARRLVVILAGYTQDMERLVAVNPGLSSRFPESVKFRQMRSSDCVTLLRSVLAKEAYLDISNLQNDGFDQEASNRFDSLIQFDSWGNARDVETIAKNIARRKLVADPDSTELLAVSGQDVLHVLEESIKERQQRALISLQAKHADPNAQLIPQPHQTIDLQQESAPPPSTVTSTSTAPTAPVPEKEEQGGEADTPAVQPPSGRDAGVSDQVWQQLQLDQQRALAQDKQDVALIARHDALEQEQRDAEEAESQLPNPGEEEEEDKEDNENMKRRLQAEKERIARELERRAREEELERLRRERAEVEQRRAQEQIAQRKLRQMGVCVAGFRWIKQASGYRCAGGSHFISDAQLDAFS